MQPNACGDDDKQSGAIDDRLATELGSLLTSIGQHPYPLSPSFEAFHREFLDASPTAKPLNLNDELVAEILIQLTFPSADGDAMQTDEGPLMEGNASIEADTSLRPEYPLTFAEDGDMDNCHSERGFDHGNVDDSDGTDDDDVRGNDAHVNLCQEYPETLVQMVQNSFGPSSCADLVTPVVKAKEQANVIEIGASKPNLFAYFDHLAHKNWAGPEHWKLRSLQNGPSAIPNKKNTKQKTATPPQLIDFCAAPEVDIKSLFAKTTSPQSITWAPETLLSERNRARNMLPEDLGISSKDLFSLFCRPNWWLSLGRGDMPYLPLHGDCSMAEKSIETVAEKILHNKEAAKYLVERGLATMLEDDTQQISTMVPVCTSSQQDDEPLFEPFDHHHGGGDDGDDDDSQHAIDASDELLFSQPFSQLSLGEDLSPVYSATTAVTMAKDWGSLGSPKFLRVDPVSYCKVSKRVNMHRLKSTMWTSLSNAALSSVGEIRLSEVIATIDAQAMGGERKKAELSFPYCFISLLHLANEHDLTLTLTLNHSDIVIKM